MEEQKAISSLEQVKVKIRTLKEIHFNEGYQLKVIEEAIDRIIEKIKEKE